ncbi:O-antigen ligase family protein [Caulobacter sp. RL271]|jgi:O-antigen ligase|uniref:O-antigen ligase family protein n=1 Tax=Caulobacter segnis TaxID=88688 RepID=A0ABY4ZNN3_9CAUL|nr:O-antigen ligase family protein [Caulobacter segnis]USQ94412.1 O-antigen ligase family protein [Caulobacter segnis]
MTRVGVSPVASERRTRWLGGLAVFMMVLTPLFGYVIPLWFAGLVSLVGLLAAPLLARSRPPLLPMFALLILVLWALVSLVWSPAAPHLADLKKNIDKFTALKLLMQLGLYGSAVVALGEMSRRSARLAGRVMVAGMLLLAFVICLDSMLKASIYMVLHRATGETIRPDQAIVKVAAGTYALALLFWPCARLMGSWGARSRYLAITALALMTLITAHLTGADAPVAALLLGGLAWLGVRTLGKPVVRVLIALISALFIFAPMVVLWGVRSGLFAWLHAMLPPSWDHRLDIWAFAANQIVEHALRGWGIDASRVFGNAIPLHTHNAALQLWLELGALGAAMAAAFFAWILYRILGWTEIDRRDGAMATGSLVAYVVIGALSFGVWQEWWLALGAIAVIACGIAQKSSAPAR